MKQAVPPIFVRSTDEVRSQVDDLRKLYPGMSIAELMRRALAEKHQREVKVNGRPRKNGKA